MKEDDLFLSTAKALSESEGCFRALFENTPDPCWLIDSNNLFVACNNAAVASLGYGSKEELKATHPSKLSPETQPDGHSSFEKANEMMAIAREKGIHRFEWSHKRATGECFPVEVTLAKISIDGKDCLYCVWRDITERKRYEEELQISASVYQAIGEAVMITDANKCIITVNQPFTRLTGYELHDVKGKTPKLFESGRHSREFFQNMWYSLEKTGHWKGEIYNRRKDGTIGADWLTIHSVYDHTGMILRYVALYSEITDQKKAEETIIRQANYDPLTNLPNRQLFQDRLDQKIKQSRRTSLLLALLFIDLDNFKEVNDTLGHKAGDELLIEAARRIGKCIRASDTVARLGGDEFTVIISEIRKGINANRVADAIIAELGKPFQLTFGTMYISASIGITIYPKDADSVDSLLKNADQAMYAAKKRGRNNYCYFTYEMQKLAQARLKYKNDLYSALHKRQFEVHYQPIVELATGRIVKAEALLRWHHPEDGLIEPSYFIPIAEECGLINAISDLVFKDAVSLASNSRNSAMQISVNVSPCQFASGTAYETWTAYLRESELPAGRMILEITEGMLIDNRPEVIKKISQFIHAGMEVAIDDFGTGYSAMGYLKKFDIDYIKIDQSFVHDIDKNHESLAITEAIIVMAHKLGIMVVAEGIETSKQRDLLIMAGCDYGQGYLFSRPLVRDEFETLLKNGK